MATVLLCGGALVAIFALLLLAYFAPGWYPRCDRCGEEMPDGYAASDTAGCYCRRCSRVAYGREAYHALRCTEIV